MAEKKAVVKTRSEMISDIMNTLLISDDINIKFLYERFFVVVDVNIDKPGEFSVSNKPGIRNVSVTAGGQ